MGGPAATTQKPLLGVAFLLTHETSAASHQVGSLSETTERWVPGRGLTRRVNGTASIMCKLYAGGGETQVKNGPFDLLLVLKTSASDVVDLVVFKFVAFVSKCDQNSLRRPSEHRQVLSSGGSMRAHTGLLLAFALLAGCTAVPDKQYQSAGFQDRSCSLSPVGRDVTCPSTATSAADAKDARVEKHFSVAYLEYCELESELCKGPGQLFSQQQLQSIQQQVEASNAAGEATLVVVYVHGWHHNASSEDGNVKYFDHMLARYADALARAGRANTRVLGVYVGWRGESIAAPIASVFTVADRGRTADLLAKRGTIASDLAVIAAAVQKGSASSRMIVTGHSFGGRLISRALLPRFEKTYLPLGDKALIVTLNAAIGADAFYELYQPARLSAAAARPTWLNITSLDDWATRRTYPVARRLGDMQPDHADDDSSGRTIGHYPPYKTHQISFANCSTVGCGDKSRMSELLAVDYWQPAPFQFFVLRYVPENGEAAVNMCGLIREYPYTRMATDAMAAKGVCADMVGTESPHTGRKRFPANGHLWNIEGDKTVIDTDGLQATSAPVHNAVTQTSLATVLVRLMYGER